MFVHNFPNAVIFGPPQAGFTANYPHSLDEQARHLAYLMGELRDRKATQIEVTEEAEQEWVDTIIEKAALNEKFLADCTPGYYNNEGKPSERAKQNASYGGGSDEYFRIIDDWRKTGELPGLAVTTE
jgi:cyclohexanone monooxygenase